MSEKNYIEGEQILLIDSKKRRYLIELKAGGEFHTHVGAVLHDDPQAETDETRGKAQAVISAIQAAHKE